MKIALTFDIERDIPNVFDTYLGAKIGLLNILKILDNYKILATFFCTGHIVERLPEYIRLIERKGHEIACHSLNHEPLNQLNFKQCQEIIYQNKKIIENTCQNSEIIGFRAPKLRPPKFLFRILNDLGFKYDSSIRSPKKLKYYRKNNYQIQEFHPSNFNILFRLPHPIGDSFIRKWIFKKKLVVLFFHPFEAADMKNLIFNITNVSNIFKNVFFRPDRLGHTGNKFIRGLNNFIKESIARKAEFICLKQLINEKD